MNRILLTATLLTFFAIAPALAQSYELPVEHEHTFRNCRGTLVITPERIEYKTVHKEDARSWSYTDLRQIKIASPVRIELVSYEDHKRMLGRDRVFKFKALEGEITPEISALLVERATRPVVASVAPATGGAPAFEASVKHLHRFGGCSRTSSAGRKRTTFNCGKRCPRRPTTTSGRVSTRRSSTARHIACIND